MKSYFKIALPVIALAAVAAVQAQSSSATNSPGVLGQRYLALSAGVFNPHGISDNGLSGDLNVRLPVKAGLDVGFGYGYNRFKWDIEPGLFTQRDRAHAAFSSVTAYTQLGGVKPFALAALGYQWAETKLSFGGMTAFEERDDEGFWGTGIGVEIPIVTLVVIPRVTYQDGFKRESPAGFNYGAEVHTWFTPKVGGFVDLTYSDPTNGGRQSWTYSIGARFRF